ncbi:MAG: 50S ribosomal protein L25 [Actinomycetes bacterium]|jgi:large subunit ribosomal protein L25|nr:50S ribosomal protein L25 [Acidimicrobiia bacterium]
MEQVSLRARTGRVPGTRASRRLRREGQVPAVVYGHGMDPINVSVDARELYAALHTDAGLNALINLDVDGQEILTMARVVERHPYRAEYRHVDFQKVSLTETVTTEVPVHFEGDPVGVREGGVLSPARTSVMVEARVTQIPSHIEVDISGLELGGVVRVADLPALDGVTYQEDPEEVIVSVTAPATEAAEEAPEGEEEAAAPAAEPAEAAEEGGEASAEE